jgi:hypothetical protein
MRLPRHDIMQNIGENIAANEMDPRFAGIFKKGRIDGRVLREYLVPEYRSREISAVSLVQLPDFP